MALLRFRVVLSGRYEETWEVMAHDARDAETRVRADEGNWIDGAWSRPPIYLVRCITADEDAARRALAAARGNTKESPIHATHQTRLEDQGGAFVERCQVCKADGIAALYRPCPGVVA